jgi:hypothetical protein
MVEVANQSRRLAIGLSRFVFKYGPGLMTGAIGTNQNSEEKPVRSFHIQPQRFGVSSTSNRYNWLSVLGNPHTGPNNQNLNKEVDIDQVSIHVH